jgi:starvation-inducible outer membrane lipoprotein
MKKRLLMISMFLVVLGCVSTPQSKKNIDFENENKKTAVAEDKNKVVCRNVKVSGTRLPRKVCRTIAEVEALAERSQRILREEQRRATQQIDNDG